MRLLKYLLKRSRVRGLEMDISFKVKNLERIFSREGEEEEKNVSFFSINIGLREAKRKDRLQNANIVMYVFYLVPRRLLSKEICGAILYSNSILVNECIRIATKRMRE